MQRLPWDGEYPRTQGWGEHPEAYARFGLLGHAGSDYGLGCGTPLLAPDDGLISQAASDPPGFGLFVRLDRPDGAQWTLAHLSRLDVAAGQWVNVGDVLGLSGTTGNSNGCHVHLGLRPQGWQDRLDNGWQGYEDPSGELAAVGQTYPPPEGEGPTDVPPPALPVGPLVVLGLMAVAGVLLIRGNR